MKETVDILAVLIGLSVKYTEMGIDSSAELMNNAADEISDLRFENSVLVSQNKFKATQIESLTAQLVQKEGEIAQKDLSIGILSDKLNTLQNPQYYDTNSLIIKYEPPKGD